MFFLPTTQQCCWSLTWQFLLWHPQALEVGQLGHEVALHAIAHDTREALDEGLHLKGVHGKMKGHARQACGQAYMGG